MKDKNKLTLLDIAARNGKLKAILELIGIHRSLELHSSTPLIHIIRGKDTEDYHRSLDTLLVFKMNPNKESSLGLPAMVAIEENNLWALKSLIHYGLNVNDSRIGNLSSDDYPNIDIKNETARHYMTIRRIAQMPRFSKKVNESKDDSILENLNPCDVALAYWLLRIDAIGAGAEQIILKKLPFIFRLWKEASPKEIDKPSGNILPPEIWGMILDNLEPKDIDFLGAGRNTSQIETDEIESAGVEAKCFM